MRILVCGGRDYTDRDAAFAKLDQTHKDYTITHIIEGGANGGDRLGREWAISREIPFTTVPAEWDKYGKSAGYKRNEVMARDHKPDGVIALPGGVGTKHMIDIAHRYKIPIEYL